MKKNTITEITGSIMQQAEEKGWGTTQVDVNVGEKIALIHAEVTEAFEEYRKNNIHGIDGMDGEMASLIISILHLSGIMEFDLEPLILQKIERNKSRNWDWDKLKKK